MWHVLKTCLAVPTADATQMVLKELKRRGSASTPEVWGHFGEASLAALLYGKPQKKKAGRDLRCAVQD